MFSKKGVLALLTATLSLATALTWIVPLTSAAAAGAVI